MFGSALACGMLMGVLAAGAQILLSRNTEKYVSGYLGIIVYSSILNWVYSALILCSPALFRRDWKLVLPAILRGLCAAIFSGLIWLSFYFVWWFNLYFVLQWVMPVVISAVVLGWSASALFGYPEQRRKFILAALLASSIDLIAGFIVFNLANAENYDEEFRAVHTMWMMISGLFMGVALSWRVDRLERERAKSQVTDVGSKV